MRGKGTKIWEEGIEGGGRDGQDDTISKVIKVV